MWRLLAIGEGLMKTLSAIFQKLAGTAMGTLEMGCLGAAIIGLIQMLSGFAGVAAQSRASEEPLRSLVPNLRSVLGVLTMGFLSGVFGTTLSIYTFTLGADMGVRTLLISASVIPSSIIASIIWPKTDTLGLRQYAGIGMFVLAMWAMLGFPDMATLATLDSWVWLVFALAASNSANELLSRAMALRFSAWANNFWVGLSTMSFSLMFLVGLALFGGGITLTLSGPFLFGIIAIGFTVVAMLSFKIWTYQGGGTIALKKIIMPGTYLVSAIAAGAMLYGEPVTAGKLAGVMLWLISIWLTDRNAAREFGMVFRSRSA
jgi:hypothetical protein